MTRNVDSFSLSLFLFLLERSESILAIYQRRWTYYEDENSAESFRDVDRSPPKQLIWIRLSVRVRPLVECKQEWRRGKRGGRYERLVRSDQGRDGKDDEVDYVFQKDARRRDTRRRHTRGGRGEYNSATRKPVFHRQPLSRETARELRTTTSKKDESRLRRPSRIAVSLSLFSP